MNVFFHFSFIIFLCLNSQSVKSDDIFLGQEENCDLRCNDDVLVSHLAACEILSPESIINLSVKEMDLLCRKLDDSIRDIDKYLKTCIPPPPGNLFMSYIAGMRVLNIKMCAADSNFFKRFTPCYQCLHELKHDFDGCSGPADWTEEGDNTKLCKTYKTIVDCYYIKSAKVCGMEAAETIKELVVDIIDSIICRTCKGIRSNPYVKDAMPPQYLKRSGSEHALVNKILISIILLNNLFYRII